MAILSPAEIYALNKKIADANGGASTQHLIEATFIVLRESGGDPSITNVVTSGESKGSIDRGLWQFNSKWHPDVTDAIAFDPTQSTQKAWQKSAGFTNWETWKFTNAEGDEYVGKPDPSSQTQKDKWETAIEAAMNTGDIDISDIPDPVGAVIDAVTPSWADALAKLLSKLISIDFWKRVGVVVIGAAVIIVALLLLFGDSTVETVKEVAL